MKLNNETKVGILAAVAITLLILGFNLLKGEKLFVSGFELKSYYSDVAGLTTGNPVLYNGLRVGQVKKIEIDKVTGRIEVVYSMEKGIQLPFDTKAVIASADLLGSKAVRIDRGTEKKMVENGGVLEGKVDPSLEDQIKTEILPIKDDIAGLIQSLDRFVGWLNNTMDESTGNKIDLILDDFVVSSRNLSRTTYRVDTLLGTFQATAYSAKSVMRNLSNQNETINRIMDNTAKFSDSLASASGSIKEIVEQSSDAVKNINSLLTDVRGGKGTLGKLVTDEGLYANVKSSSERMDSLLEHFQNSPRIPIDVRLQLGNPELKEKRMQNREDRRLRRQLEK